MSGDVHILFPAKAAETEQFIQQQSARRFTGSWVYFMQAGPRRTVKIGISRDPLMRASRLQTGTPEEYRILAVMPGGKAEEAEMHARFAAHRVRGEWFKRTPEMTALINELNRRDRDLFTGLTLERVRLVEERQFANQWKQGVIR